MMMRRGIFRGLLKVIRKHIKCWMAACIEEEKQRLHPDVERSDYYEYKLKMPEAVDVQAVCNPIGFCTGNLPFIIIWICYIKIIEA